MNIFLSPFAPENLVSRHAGSAVPSSVSLLISILRLNLVLTYGIPPEFRGGVHLCIYSTMSSSNYVFPLVQTSLTRQHPSALAIKVAKAIMRPSLLSPRVKIYQMYWPPCLALFSRRRIDYIYPY